MRGIPSRTGLATLTEAANAVVPAVVLGVSRSLDEKLGSSSAWSR